MLFSKAQKLKAESGDKDCEHPKLKKEYFLGLAATGEYICTTCGKTGFGPDWVEREKGATKS